MSTLEFVQTVPWEANLEEKGMRHSLEVFLEMINNAKKTLDIQQFYIFSLKNQPMERRQTRRKSAGYTRQIFLRYVPSGP